LARETTHSFPLPAGERERVRGNETKQNIKM